MSFLSHSQNIYLTSLDCPDYMKHDQLSLRFGQKKIVSFQVLIEGLRHKYFLLEKFPKLLA